MKYSVILAAAFAAVASAQATREDLPECARPCIIDAVGSETDCDIDDISCSCTPENNAAIRAKATTCVIGACTGDDLTETLRVSGELCVGVPPPSEGGDEEVPPPAETTTPPPAEDDEEVPPPAEDDEEVPPPAETTPPPAEDDEEDVGAPETVYVTVCDSSSVQVPAPAPTANGTAITPPAPSFTGAASKMGAGLGSVAVLALAAIAL